MSVQTEAGGAVPTYSGSELLDLMPEAKDMASLIVHDFGKYPGPHMTPKLMFTLSNIIAGYLRDDSITGVVVTHGTDTLEETAYLLDLTLKTEVPVVVTGSMRNSSDPDWDGPRNLIDAIHICLHQNARNLGVLVCLNGEINAASEVTKTHTEDVETFHSLDFGSLGFVERGRVIINRLPRKLETIETKRIETNIDLIKTYAGISEKFFKLSADYNVQGLVVEAMGVGNVPPRAFNGIEYVISKNIPVVLVSRCPAGETLDTYTYHGAGGELQKIGVIFTDYLNGQKARVKLMLALGKTRSMKRLKTMFEEDECCSDKQAFRYYYLPHR